MKRIKEKAGTCATENVLKPEALKRSDKKLRCQVKGTGTRDQILEMLFLGRRQCFAYLGRVVVEPMLGVT